ncbi:MAG: YabP/YqfC family sporulation protein [Lachnospiraceae bacterium]|nr:YabP/YqfC family sporulation protein [Lachnospiraceae bacterium]
MEKLTSDAMIPKDTLPGNTCVSLTGQKEVIIENYKGILEYTSEKLIIMTSRCKIEISGKHLEICYYAKEEMKVTGLIQCVSYCRPKT